MQRSAAYSLVVALLMLLATPAHAAPRDAAANQKIEESINSYYLATEFDKAEALLKGVIEACEDRCSPNVKARAWMYIGVVQGSGRQNLPAAQEAFQQGLALDPTLKLDEALATPETRQSFAAAAASLGQAPAETGGTTEAPTPAAEAGEEPAAAGGAVPGSMECTPTVTEVEAQRSIPVACTTDEPAVKVTLRYLAFGSENWGQVQMTKKGEYWQGEIPCSDTSITGTLKYYVQAKDKDGEELDSHGNKKTPATINIVANTTQEPPSYPGQPAPQKCMAASECPEEMVGTPACPSSGPKRAARGGKGWGTPCDQSQECDVGLLCMQGENGRTCESAPSCTNSNECPSGSICKSGTCDLSDEEATPSGPYKKNLLGIHFAADLGFMPGGEDVCRDDRYSCYFSNNNPVPEGRTLKGNAGGINGGPAFGTMRILLSYERLLSTHFGLEARAGFAFGGGPPASDGTAFLPIHAEGRLKYWIGRDLFTRKGLRPYVFLGGGIAQVDTKLTVPIVYDSKPANDETQYVQTNVNVYRKLGQAFVSGGAGAMYAIAPRHGVVLNVNFMYMLGNSGAVLEPSLGYQFGF